MKDKKPYWRELIQFIDGKAYTLSPHGRTIYLGTEEDVLKLLEAGETTEAIMRHPHSHSEGH